MRWIMAIVLGTVMFASVIGTIASQFLGARYHGGNLSLPTNITGASGTLLGLATLVIVIVFLYRIAR